MPHPALIISFIKTVIFNGVKDRVSVCLLNHQASVGEICSLILVPNNRLLMSCWYTSQREATADLGQMALVPVDAMTIPLSRSSRDRESTPLYCTAMHYIGCNYCHSWFQGKLTVIYCIQHFLYYQPHPQADFYTHWCIHANPGGRIRSCFWVRKGRWNCQPHEQLTTRAKYCCATTLHLHLWKIISVWRKTGLTKL